MRNKNIIAFHLSSIIFAFIYAAIAYFLIYRLIARGDIFLTYLCNVIYIIIMLFLDNVAHKFAERKSEVIKNMLYIEMRPVSRFFYMFTQGSTLTAIYIFYIAMLVLSQIATLKPGLFPYELGSFFASIEYGIIILVVFDRLRDLVQIDKNWFMKYLAPKVSDENE